ncbi:hypothetical protein [Phnomibacter sp. MR]|uniref:hypothetical protein n=1 Tax=Phnomibacter sp. MR TaxID=3042318 RepID=UPI003A80B0CE
MQQQPHISFWKKTGTVLAIVAMLLPAWYAADFLIERTLHRMDMWQKVEQSMLQTIRIDSAAIHWTKEGRELIVDNEYFDVATIRYEKGVAIISGVFDERESAMHAAFAKAQQQHQSNDGDSGRMAQWLLKHWAPGTSFHLYKPVVFIAKKAIGEMANMYLQIHCIPPTPPPKQLLYS